MKALKIGFGGGNDKQIINMGGDHSQILAVLRIQADTKLCDFGDKFNVLLLIAGEHRSAEEGAADINSLTFQVIHCHNIDQCIYCDGLTVGDAVSSICQLPPAARRALRNIWAGTALRRRSSRIDSYISGIIRRYLII
ncbi:unnamed protein product [Sphagnum jensenii]|uniref:Uncharacterized protein n=1 Tax=Sphagnum jensenii TaxID=128206 RepID=A0ABP1A178_9BRYO